MQKIARTGTFYAIAACTSLTVAAMFALTCNGIQLPMLVVTCKVCIVLSYTKGSMAILSARARRTLWG